MKMKYYLNIIFLFITVVLCSCDNCEKKIRETNKGEMFETLNDDYNIYEESNSFTQMRSDTFKIKCHRQPYDIYGEPEFERYLRKGQFDSIYYEYDRTNLIIEYFHLSSCNVIIPRIMDTGDTLIIRCLTVRKAELNCENGKVSIIRFGKSCLNVIKWQINIDKKEVSNKKILFQPQKFISFEIPNQ